jgi:hypothetical protein
VIVRISAYKSQRDDRIAHWLGTGFYISEKRYWTIVYNMEFLKALTISSLLILITAGASAVGPAEYDGGVQVNLESNSLSPGETVDAEISTANSDERPVVDGYVVVNVAKGAEPYYPSQKSDEANVFHQEKIEGINLRSGNGEAYDFSYSLPEDLKAGDYRVEVYFKTERTPVEGLPFVYSTPSYESFTVSGSSGDYPGLDISRTETFFTGVDEVVGDWDPESLNFRNTIWPSLTGPVGVLTTGSMDNVDGEVVIDNPSGTSTSATLDITVCEWDDTSCSNQVDSVTRSVEVPASGATVPVEVENPEDPSAYAIKMNVSSDGRTQSIYRNRIIREGNTSRIRKLSVNRPYVEGGDQLSVGLVAGASPDHYNDPSAEGVNAEITVEADGEEVFSQSKEINRLSNANTFEQLYFNSTVDETLTAFTVSAELSANGEVYDTHSYEVDYSDFSNDIEAVNLRSYGFSNETLNAEICGETDSGAPAVGEMQVLVRENASVRGESQKMVEDCSSFSFEDVESGSYKLVANYGSQATFNITEEGLEPETSDEGGIPYTPIVMALIALVIGIVFFRGVKDE